MATQVLWNVDEVHVDELAETTKVDCLILLVLASIAVFCKLGQNIFKLVVGIGHVLLELVELRRTEFLPVEQGHHAEQLSNR